ncbi:Tim44 domain-containing protein [Devosia sediminis]|uniref:Tim44 domain-containing protein n=1 Tax=Devosia sediminis TaxID=2798801 RepID=A0A934IQ53_9HYPH|nr:Tim44 domain-containing protein [Devosia sediminis]MBJ3784778.1 Tim44 domain-containing protein [Devosia sediminis]
MFAARSFRFTSLIACLVVAFSFISVGDAEARKGGSFGSRGMNTFNSPAPTQTAPAPVAPVQRTMTPNQQQNTPSPSAQSAQPRGGFMNGFGGSLVRGLFIGGLFGLFLGAGFGGIGGVFAMLVQIAMIGGLIWLALRFFRPRTATAGGPDVAAYERRPAAKPDFSGMFGSGGSAARPAAHKANPNQLNIGMEDLEKFESMLTRVQAAFAGENYAALRTLTTPEVMGYLSEELATNATNGVKNQVSDVKLLQGDLSESWREGQVEYATVAMRYSAVDYMVDRQTGAVVEGDADTPGESTEIWTFIRNRGDGDWRLSAIQEASN